jgi:hypothetical protein
LPVVTPRSTAIVTQTGWAGDTFVGWIATKVEANLVLVIRTCMQRE